jgi:hypothetical protein
VNPKKDALGSAPQAAAFRYQRKIRETLNPNDLGDAYHMTLPEQNKLSNEI